MKNKIKSINYVLNVAYLLFLGYCISLNFASWLWYSGFHIIDKEVHYQYIQYEYFMYLILLLWACLPLTSFFKLNKSVLILIIILFLSQLIQIGKYYQH